MDKLPIFHSRSGDGNRVRRAASKFHIFAVFCIACSLTYTLQSFLTLTRREDSLARSSHVPSNAQDTLLRCRKLSETPGPPEDFHLRSASDRYEPGTSAVLLRNASIWAGRGPSMEVIHGDVLLDKGLVKAVGHVTTSQLHGCSDLRTINLYGAWVTPGWGIVDMHSHLGVDSVPTLQGSTDLNSRKGIAQPWLRSLDGLNSHDEAYRLSRSGGVTTANVLPGSANAIGGQAFTIKLRSTKERSVSSMLLEPPYDADTMRPDPFSPPRWRQMKHACGENPSNVYSGTRMDTMWSFRQSYETARKVKQQQDEYCHKALSGDWDGLGGFPENLQWEALVDVLRGRVKVHTHCYEATDLDGILTNEFNFSIAAFHHAHETYLVPDLLKKAYGHPPAVALFATNARYKREAYRGSEFAPRILADNGLQVVMKSDHPVLNSRNLLFEAQQAFYYGLSENLALASITSTPATVLGLDHRIGFIKAGYDADVVVWDSHPLALGATPKQVYIDGIPQLEKPYIVEKPPTFQELPKRPNFDKERNDTLKFDGLPPLEPDHSDEDTIAFTNVNNVHIKNGSTVTQLVSATAASGMFTVLARKGKIMLCASDIPECGSSSLTRVKQVNLEGGSISPALVTYGSTLGLEHIEAEPSTTDGVVNNAFESELPDIIGGSGAVIQAVDGLQFSTRDALLAYRAGVTSGIVAPVSFGLISGLSTFFDTGAPHRLANSAVLQETAAFHVAIGTSGASISTQIAALRHLLLGNGEGNLAQQVQRIVKGELPLVVDVDSADIMSSLIQLKEDIEAYAGSKTRFVFSGASEAHLLAKQIGEANIGVILNPSRPFPSEWRSRRILAGKPITEKNALLYLMEHNVTVGFGVQEKWMARSLRFDLGWAAIEVHGKISEAETLAVGSTNLEKLLGVEDTSSDLVATHGGGLLDSSSKVVAVISEKKAAIDLI
ncbi:hypothetical protein APHAL10511_004881 [Amanita phalloides]|nr:hypothetical protein APHAL10511_004881 [Amanita phalloides]